MPGESLNLDICCCRVSKNGEFGIYVKEGGWGTYEDNDVRYVFFCVCLHVYVPEFAVCGMAHPCVESETGAMCVAL